MSDTEGKKLVLFDGHSIINRAFYGMPDLTNSKGVHTGAVYGFLNIMFRILDEEKPDYLIVAFDEAAPTFRHKMYSEYKGTRKPMPEELKSQVPLLKDVLRSMGITICSRPGLEADDILGTYAKKAESEGMTVSLISGDRDLLQIADEKICVRIPKTVRGQTTVENYHAEDVKTRYNITPAQVIEIKGLMGDSADNIPGVPKVGEKTAHQLIESYGSVDGVYEHLDEITKKALHQTLEEHRDLAYLSLKLATIRIDCDLPFDFENDKAGGYYTKEAYAVFTELGFRNYLSRFDDEAAAGAAQSSPEEENTESKLIKVGNFRDAEDAFAVIKSTLRRSTEEKPGVIGIDIVRGTGKPGKAAEMLGASVSVPGVIYSFDFGAVPLKQDAEGQIEFRLGEPADAKNSVDETADPDESAAGAGDRFDASYLAKKLGETRRLAREKGGIIAVFDAKNLYPYFDIKTDEFGQSGIRLEGIFDTLIGCYLLNPLKDDYTAEDVIQESLGTVLQAYVQIFGKKSEEEAMAEDRDRLLEYSEKIADGLRKSAPGIIEKLKKEEMWDLYTKIELPLSFILYDMQRIGIRALPERLMDYSRELGRQAEELESRIYKETGEEFNIASPRQLGEILFEKMHLPGGKKTKTGWSTAADVLEKLAPDYPAVQDILDYRAVTKLKSTYADGLPAFIAQDGRIHTVFHQTITATGRISSSDPNLQNIPMRTEMGRLIRKAFVPADGYVFTDSDYSQIELRILANMSGDEELIKAYRENKDIHRITASKVFHVPFEDVTPLQRRNAKAVNFGIVYGISAFGLSNNIGISRKEAQDYIDTYFQMYPGIKKYLDDSVQSAKEKGYSVTMYGRRRPIPELKNSNFMTRQFGERVAMNAPIQGTAADIMKIAMIHVWERIHREKLKSELILQIHDELLIETAPGEENEVSAILSEEMKGAADLPVTLETDVHTGSDWYEAK